MTLYRLYEFLFNRWKREVVEEGNEQWFSKINGVRIPESEFTRNYVKYKYTNKFDGSTKIKIVYI